MNYYNRGGCCGRSPEGRTLDRAGYGGRKQPVCRSAFMRSEEIDRERAMSGWNPYRGEEEVLYEDETTEEMLPENPAGEPEAVQPYFRMPDYEQIVEEQKMTERDLRRLQGMYPDAAKRLLPYIEEECDKMEYEGSAMYDEYPDPTTVRRIQETIQEQVRDQYPQETPEEPDEMLSMQYGGRRRNPPGKNWLGDLIQVLLLQEMHHRRCRHGKCRRRY